jgi:hypothetical protein
VRLYDAGDGNHFPHSPVTLHTRPT